ncbi:hypothetical protein CYCD_10680 [Tenuifilaceae bacterium CYCD]|nr:hypothetical protein CYCD_10680 [Tenuifilaceae bacterium CYCD]
MAGFGLRSNAYVIYVNHAATGSNNGTSWLNAYKSLQSALDAAASGDQIWVARGTYYPSSAYTLTVSGDRDFHFEMKEGVAIYGGFYGTETTTTDRTSFGVGQTNETILSGDIGTVGKNTDNCYHVIYNPATLALTNSAVIDGFTITGGYAYTSPSYTYGGGMYNCSSSPTLVNITFVSNSATYGGAISNLNSSPVLINVSIVSNNAGHGSGMYNLSSSPILNNVTIAANTAAGNGGGIYNKSSSPVFKNSIIWGNLAGTANQIYNESGTIALNYSCYANAPGDITNTGTLTATNNNTTSNPLFYNAMASDCRLTANSPCLDAGLDSYNSQTYDIRGKGYSRKLLKSNASAAGAIDMGAYEYQSGECTTKKIYVNASASGSNNGTTWGNAYTSLQTAIVNANFGDVIWVANGTYKPTSAYCLTNTSRYYHFEMKEGVAIYGGFAGTETSTSERIDFGYGQTNETILSGDVGTVGSSTDNCYHVIYNPSSLTNAAIIDGFTITGGNANDLTHYHGGGMCNNSNGSPIISNVVFIANYGNNGGGMFNYNGSSPTLNNVSFIGNSSKHGGGMYNWKNSSPVITNAKFLSNISLGEGGAISSFSGAQVTITNGIIASNTAVTGGGIHCQSSSPLALTNVTIAANTATDDAGGVYCNSSATFNNCILWGNTSQKLFQDMDIFSGNTVTMNYSCHSNVAENIGNGGTFTTTNHNVTTNPVFADAEHGDFRIKKVSPCVNAGYDDYNSLTTDIRGTGYVRKIGTIDMGAYEYNSTVDTDVDVVIKYVNANLTTGSYDGTTWDNAYTSLQTALENASPGDQIWVAKGTYKPSSAYDLPNPTHVLDPTIDPTRYYHFRMKADVAIYGGFAGNEARAYDLSLRDFTTNETILSGDVGTEKDFSDNCLHVIYNPASSALAGTAVLDGFTVTGGYANGNYPHKFGAGMYNNACSPTISNVIFFDNTTNEYGCGGGMYNEKSSPTLTNVAFTENHSCQGGGMYNAQSVVSLTNVSFTDNYAYLNGGGLYSTESSVTLTNCTFIKNVAALSIGGGGGMYHYDGSSILNNVTFSLNEAVKGGGIYLIGNTPILNNCILWGNISTDFGHELYIKGNSTTYLNYCCFQNTDNALYEENGSSFTIDDNTITTDPLFVNPAIGDCRISDGSSCIDKGNNIYNSTSTDIRGQARVQNSTIDIGAYEWTNGLDFICTNPTSGGEISSNQHICEGATPKALNSKSIPTGYKGTLEYQWQSSTTSEAEGFSDIASANAETYAPGKLTATTWYKRLARVNCMDDWTGAAESNVIAVEVVEVTNPYLAVENNSVTYDGSVKTVVVNIKDDETIEWYDDDFNFYTNLSGTNVGTYSLYPVVANVNYGCAIDEFTPISLTINKADLIVTPIASQSKIYGDDDPIISYTYTPELASGNALSGTLARVDGENVGNYAISMGTLSAGNNYTLTLSDAEFSIIPKRVTVTPNASQSKVYGDLDPILGYDYTPDLLAGNSFSGQLSRESGNNVGSYSITIGTLSSGDNYLIDLFDAEFSITPKPITVIPDALQSKVYGDLDPILTYTHTPELLVGDSFSGELSREMGENVESYGIAIGTLSAGNNYAITLSDADFTITPKPVTVTANPQSKVYGGTDPDLTYSVSPSLAGADAFTGSLSRVVGENVGTYAINQNTLSLSSNYTLSFVSDNLTITPLAITVTANPQSKVYGGTDPDLTYSVSPSLAGADAFTGSLSRVVGENVGTYAINQNTLSLSSNYTLSFVSDNLTITPLAITVTANPQSKVYGGTDPDLTYSVSPSLAGADAFTGSLSRVVGENVGTYAINQNTLSLSSNYTLSFVSDNLTITPLAITVTANPQSKVYGEDDPGLTYTTYPALFAGDAFTGFLVRSIGENVGTYPINSGTLGAGSNYTIVFVSSDLSITPKSVEVFAEFKSKTYGDADPELTYTAGTQLLSGNTFTGVLDRQSGESVGLYAITIGSLSAGSNYSISFTAASLEITPKPLTITDPTLTTAKQYDGTTVANVQAGTLLNIIASDESNISVSAQAYYDNASIGEDKTITVSYTLSGSASGNYLKPSDFVVNNGIICDKTTIEVLQSPKAGCEGGTLALSYTILTGEPVEYQVLFGDDAVAAGFVNIGYSSLPASSGTGTITIAVPEGLRYGAYMAQLQLRNNLGAESELYPFSFTINLSSDYLIGKFDDVILCDNSSNMFTAYQWYKNDNLVNGATNQYYCDPSGLSGSYFVQVTTTDGKTLETCPAVYNMVTKKIITLIVYPNPAVSGQTFTVQVNGVSDEDITGATLQIYSIQGLVLYKTSKVEILNHVNLNNLPGNYIVRITTAKGKMVEGKVVLTK